jgi:hypothetical protein
MASITIGAYGKFPNIFCVSAVQILFDSTICHDYLRNADSTMRAVCILDTPHSKTLLSLIQAVTLVPNQLRTTPWRHIGDWRYCSTFLNLSIKWEWSASCPCHFTPKEIAPRASLDTVEKYLALAGNWTFTPQSSTQQPRCYTDWATLAAVTHVFQNNQFF